MLPYNKNLFITIFWAILGISNLLFGYFYITTKLSKNLLSAINLKFVDFLTYSIVAVVGLEIIGCVLTFIKKNFALIFAFICYAFLAFFSLFLLAESLTKIDKITDSYGYVFFKEEYMKFANEMQKHFGCCGWENSTYIYPEMKCTGPLVCKTSVHGVIKSSLMVMSIMCFVSFIFLCITLFFTYKLIIEEKHTVPKFDEYILSSVEQN